MTHYHCFRALAPLALLVLGFAWASPASADGRTETVEFAIGDDKMVMELPAWSSLPRQQGGDDQLQAWWTGTVGKSEVLVELRTFSRKEYDLQDPEGVASFTVWTEQQGQGAGDRRFSFDERTLVKGTYGALPYGVVCTGTLPSKADPRGELILLGGVMDKVAYALTYTCTPALAEADRGRVLEALRTGVQADCKKIDPKWSKEEIAAALTVLEPDAKRRKKWKRVVRTEHYIIFTNSGAGKLFAKKMESFYDTIQKVFPFEEVPGRRLMPVYLYKLPKGYYEFCARVPKWTRGQAEATMGHAWLDYYATSYASPNDPVHIHEAAHQVFANRLYLTGGGSWFQEGVAEYLATKPGHRKAYAKSAARRGRYSPFDVFIRTEDLIAGGQQSAHEAYLQAASIIEFVRDGKFHPKKFQDFIRRMGMVMPNNEEAIEQVLQDVYGVDVAGFEEAWLAYWKKR